MQWVIAAPIGVPQFTFSEKRGLCAVVVQSFELCKLAFIVMQSPIEVVV